MTDEQAAINRRLGDLVRATEKPIGVVLRAWEEVGAPTSSFAAYAVDIDGEISGEISDVEDARARLDEIGRKHGVPLTGSDALPVGTEGPVFAGVIVDTARKDVWTWTSTIRSRGPAPSAVTSPPRS
jgi:hypothetical protein